MDVVSSSEVHFKSKRQQPNTAVAQKYFFLSEVLKKGSFTMTKKVFCVWQHIKKYFVFFEKFQIKQKKKSPIWPGHASSVSTNHRP